MPIPSRPVLTEHARIGGNRPFKTPQLAIHGSATLIRADRPPARRHAAGHAASTTLPRAQHPSTPLPSPDEMYALGYEELKRIARHQLRAAGTKATLSTTDLVHEAFLKLGRGPNSGSDGRAHFFGAASRAMRQVLVDFARRQQGARRGGGQHRVSLNDAAGALEVRGLRDVMPRRRPHLVPPHHGS